jgi:hypothetical protein
MALPDILWSPQFHPDDSVNVVTEPLKSAFLQRQSARDSRNFLRDWQADLVGKLKQSETLVCLKLMC